ncbi:uncharacterized protein LOC144448721 [Glandiceps talaboti]
MMSHGYESGSRDLEEPIKYIRWETTGIPGIVLFSSAVLEMYFSFQGYLYGHDGGMCLLRGAISTNLVAILAMICGCLAIIATKQRSDMTLCKLWYNVLMNILNCLAALIILILASIKFHSNNHGDSKLGGWCVLTVLEILFSSVKLGISMVLAASFGVQAVAAQSVSLSTYSVLE